MADVYRVGKTGAERQVNEVLCKLFTNSNYESSTQ